MTICDICNDSTRGESRSPLGTSVNMDICAECTKDIHKYIRSFKSKPVIKRGNIK